MPRHLGRAVSCAIALSVAACVAADKDRADGPRFPNLGSRAPEFGLSAFFDPRGPQYAGDVVRLSERRGTIILLNFWSTFCDPCLAKQPALNAFATRYAGQPVQVYGVLIDDTRARALAWLNSNGGASFPMLLDSDGVVKRRYLVGGIPHMTLISPDGRVAGECLGCADFAEFYGSRIDSMLRRPTPPLSTADATPDGPTLPNKRLKLAARVDWGMNLSSARRSLSAIR